MRVLLVGPRFHTNQYQMVKTLQEQNHEVFFHVASLGSTEDYSLLTPCRYKQSKLSIGIEKIFGKGGVNRPNYFPDLIQYWKALRILKPDIVIIRDPYRFFSFIAAFYSTVLKARIIFYTQENLFRPRNRKTRRGSALVMARNLDRSRYVHICPFFGKTTLLPQSPYDSSLSTVGKGNHFLPPRGVFFGSSL